MSQNESEFIPIFQSVLPRPDKWLHYLETAYNNSKFSNFGEVSHLLERRVAEFLGVRESNVVTCVNATQALTGAVCTSEKNNLEWTIPSWTFTATAAAMISANKTFYFSDIDENWRLAPQDSRVNAVDVLPFGDGIDISRLENLCEGELVIDAAASFDALRFSNLGNTKRRFALVISFHPTKFPAGPEGAVFISNDLDWCKRFRYWTIFGMDEARESFFPGTNAKMNEFSAAVALASLDSYRDDRSKLITQLRKARELTEKSHLVLFSPSQREFAAPYWIIKANERRIELIENLFSKEMISTRRWWMHGCHQMEAYKHIPKTSLLNTENAAKTSLGLPLFIEMGESHWQRIERLLQAN